jgi:hypothetical protein
LAWARRIKGFPQIQKQEYFPVNKRSFIISTGAVMMLCMLATGYAAIAAEYGSAEDPLITQSYIDEVLTPKTQRQIEVQNALDARFLTLASDEDFMRKVAAQVGSATDVSGWQAVTVSSGETLKLSAGSQVVVRSGSAKCISSGGAGLTDLSAGAKLPGGDALAASSLYYATTEGSGFRASTEVKALVVGSYTIS